MGLSPHPFDAGRADGIPEGTSGRWSVQRVAVSQEDANLDRLQALVGGSARHVRPGTYTQLLRGRTVVMSDTPDELRDHSPLLGRSGRLLVNGLGLGCGLRMALADRLGRPVEHIDVVEIDADVIALVGPSFADDPRVTIHHADAFAIQWPKGTRWDFAWHDVWDSISTENLTGPGSYEALHRKYGRRVGSQESWAFHLVKRYQRAERSSPW
jgi:spermidine synthase